MFWVIRWTDVYTDADKAIVVEARSRAEAEYMGLKRGIPIVFLGHATRTDMVEARRAGLLWRYTTLAPFTCLGRPLNYRQVAALMLAGLATASLHLGPVLHRII